MVRPRRAEQGREARGTAPQSIHGSTRDPEGEEKLSDSDMTGGAGRDPAHRSPMRKAEQRRCDGELLHGGPFLVCPLSFTASSSPAHLLSDDGEVV
jgi:hypothetical protein